MSLCVTSRVSTETLSSVGKRGDHLGRQLGGGIADGVLVELALGIELIVQRPQDVARAHPVHVAGVDGAKVDDEVRFTRHELCGNLDIVEAQFLSFNHQFDESAACNRPVCHVETGAAQRGLRIGRLIVGVIGNVQNTLIDRYHGANAGQECHAVLYQGEIGFPVADRRNRIAARLDHGLGDLKAGLIPDDLSELLRRELAVLGHQETQFLVDKLTP